tara:strand:- start:7594 stop:8772 length:1179 start_codon:yes stop_codon:yes gene_type:complete
MKIEKKNLIKLYNLPEKVNFCKKCTMSNQRPRITFDQNGVCSACNFIDFKKNKINWNSREEELKKLLDQHRKSNGEYDVIVPCSGGKDGSYVAHQLKYVYGMNPLTVTFAPSIYTDIGRRNIENFIRIGGFDNIVKSVSGDIHRKLMRLSFLFIGDNFQPFVYGQTNFPLHAAVQNNVKLIFYGENGEVEYGGDMKNANSPTREITDHNKHYFSGKPPEFWEEHGVKKNDLVKYMAPDIEVIKKEKIEIHFFSYYKYWDPQENFYYCVDKTGFETNEERSEGTYSKYASLDDKTDGFHYYLSYIKFGIGRATSDSAHEIRDGKISRDEGISLVKKFDGEFPIKNFKETLDYMEISESEFNEVIDSWRSPHIWKKNSNDQWELNYPIWKSNIF